MHEMSVQSLSWEDPPGGGNGNLIQYSLTGKFHGQRALVHDNSPRGCKEQDNSKQLSTSAHSRGGWALTTR